MVRLYGAYILPVMKLKIPLSPQCEASAYSPLPTMTAECCTAGCVPAS